MATIGNGYEFHAFLSYRKLGHVPDLVKDLLLDLLGFRLTEALGGVEAKIFHFEEDVHAGDEHPGDVANGLLHSIVIVPIWNMSYFHSDNCLAELETFAQRPRNPANKNATMIVPILMVEPDRLPERVQSTQGVKFSDLDYVPTVLINNAALLKEFEDQVKKLAKEIARQIGLALAYSPTFPIVTPKAIKDSVDLAPEPPKIAKPSLAA